MYLVYLCLCIDLALFMSYLCDLFSIFSLIFIVINHITSLKQMHLFFVYCLDCSISHYFWMITMVKIANNSQITKVQSQGAA